MLDGVRETAGVVVPLLLAEFDADESDVMESFRETALRIRSFNAILVFEDLMG